jgi:uncharacterized protein (TIGR03790 family)
MRNCFFFLFLSFLCISNTKAQTNANVAGPENVLVVYKNNSGISDSIMQYYTNARDIPASNSIGITLPDTAYFNGDRVILVQEGEVIKRDASCSDYNSNGWCTDTSAWKYYKQYIADTIAYYLNNTIDPYTGQYLKDQIRYIVLCKGIPIKIMSGDPYTVTHYAYYYGQYGVNVPVDALLCLLKTNSNSNPDILSLYYSKITNTYYQNDLDFDFDHRFNSNHYTSGSWKLSYLVSRLDGQNYEDIELMINRGVNANKSGEGVWILDGDPSYSQHSDEMTATKNVLDTYGFNYIYDTGDSCIITSANPVIGYSSQGLHTGDNNPSGNNLDSGYVHNQLDFDYFNGAIFNTYESFNYYSTYAAYGRDDHGLLSEFVTRRPSDSWAGTGGNGHTWEPFTSGTVRNQYYFPAYAMGYSIVDAAYLGMQYLAWQNVVVGDPLTTIAWGKQLLTENIEMEGTNLITGELDIPAGNTISISDSAILNFRHDGFITGDGLIITDTTFTLNTIDWQKSVFKSIDDNHPKIIWAAYPDTVAITGYKIFRKWRNDYYEELGEVNQNTFSYIDVDVDVIIPGSEVPKNAFYYVQALFQTEPYTSISNTVDYWVERAQKNVSGIEKFSYQLLQNYPNPFNPLTTINFEIPVSSKVMLKIYGILGNEITTLINDVRAEGIYSVQFDASDFPSGVYIYKLQAGTFVSTRKMMLVK